MSYFNLAPSMLASLAGQNTTAPQRMPVVDPSQFQSPMQVDPTTASPQSAQVPGYDPSTDVDPEEEYAARQRAFQNALAMSNGTLPASEPPPPIDDQHRADAFVKTYKPGPLHEKFMQEL